MLTASAPRGGGFVRNWGKATGGRRRNDGTCKRATGSLSLAASWILYGVTRPAKWWSDDGSCQKSDPQRHHGNVVCERAEIANTLWLRFRGLLGRDSLPAGHGMLIEPEPSIHSAFMRFDFDAVFLSREFEVVKLVERIPPWRAHSAKGARRVLELAAGEIERRGIELGDVLAVVETAEVAEHAEATRHVEANQAVRSVDSSTETGVRP